MVMIDQYIFGGLVASLFGLALLYKLGRRIRKTKAAHLDECITREAADGGDLRQAADVIIVGAGVAGAALAYTLGKVMKSYVFFFSF